MAKHCYADCHLWLVNVTYKPFLLCIIMLHVVILSAIMLSVQAPQQRVSYLFYYLWDWLIVSGKPAWIWTADLVDVSGWLYLYASELPLIRPFEAKIQSCQKRNKFSKKTSFSKLDFSFQRFFGSFEGFKE